MNSSLVNRASFWPCKSPYWLQFALIRRQHTFYSPSLLHLASREPIESLHMMSVGLPLYIGIHAHACLMHATSCRNPRWSASNRIVCILGSSVWACDCSQRIYMSQAMKNDILPVVGLPHICLKMSWKALRAGQVFVQLNY